MHRSYSVLHRKMCQETKTTAAGSADSIDVSSIVSHKLIRPFSKGEQLLSNQLQAVQENLLHRDCMAE